MEQKIVSTFFTNTPIEDPPNTSKNIHPKTPNQVGNTELTDKFLHIVDELNISLEQLCLPSTIQCVYNPTIYARQTFEMYIRKYCNTTKPILYFGMNPGPWGMSQTGVPFGEVSSVRDWLCIEGTVNKPPKEIAARPVKGFECPRTEISGKRFWGLFRNICRTPEKFFQTSFVYNYLPQQWMKSNGCNVTPADLKANELDELYGFCDSTFAKVLELYEVEKIIAVGKFCETRAHKVVKKYLPSNTIQILYMVHPSPRSVNNSNWDQKAIKFLEDCDLMQYYR